MSEENENGVQGEPTEVEHQVDPGGGTDDSGSQQGNDLYAQYLERFPSSLHPIATEVFKEWDGNVTKRIQSVHEEYEPYKPFVEQYEADDIAQAIALAEAMERDPQAFYNALAQAYNLGQPEPQAQAQYEQELINPAEEEFDDPNAQRLAQHEELLRAMAESMLAERQEREQAIEFEESERAYVETMTNLANTYGDFDLDYVNTLMAQGVDPDTAVQHWQSQVQAYAQRQLAPNQTAPIVMGAGGGTPSIQRDVENLSSQETRALVEQMLRAAKEG